MEDKITKVNHYLSQLYLRQWESSGGKIWFYRTLVSHKNVPLWQEDFIKNTAFYTHLYSIVENGEIFDEMENWFNSQFETPGLKVVKKVLIGDLLKPFDWHILLNYLALHDLRTPARLQEYLERATLTTKMIIDDLIKNFPKDLQDFKEQNLDLESDEFENRKFPFKMTPILKEREETANLKIETDIGRASWLDGIRHQLENTSKILREHKWTILNPSYGQNWFTTDKPVMRLNFRKGEYNFKGGWNSKGTEIFFSIKSRSYLIL